MLINTYNMEQNNVNLNKTEMQGRNQKFRSITKF